MKRKLLVCALAACAMTLCLALAGCGGGATNDKDAKEAFIGSWKLAGMVSDGEEATAEDIAMLDAFGMSVGLNVNEDGTCGLILFGESLDGTWEAKSATEATFTIDGSPITATITDGKLQMNDDGYAMTFERGEVKADGSATGDAKAATTDDKDAVAVDKVLVDDENCTITVLNKKKDWLDDCGYTFKFENKTADKTILFMAEYGTFSVDGQMVDLTLSETVKPGMFVESFGFFDNTKISDLDALKNVAGTISLMDNDTYDTVASYPIELA